MTQYEDHVNITVAFNPKEYINRLTYIKNLQVLFTIQTKLIFILLCVRPSQIRILKYYHSMNRWSLLREQSKVFEQIKHRHNVITAFTTKTDIKCQLQYCLWCFMSFDCFL